MKPVWDIRQPDPELVREVSAALGNDPLAAVLLVNRGIISPKAARAFLNPSLSQIQPPQNLKDVKRAAERIATALKQGEKILVFGDYDVDGVTATVLLLEFLRDAGARVAYYIPHRRHEGYGLQVRHIEAVAIPGDYGLIITVDCGIGSHAAIAAAMARGIDVIVTDHHLPSDDLPEAVAVVNPKRRDCHSGLDHLAGVGMAFYLLIQLRARLRQDGFWKTRGEPDLRTGSDLVALGTIADMVPLIRENRAFTRIGLQYLSTGQRPGLAALMDIGRVKAATVDTDDIAFRLAPRINAAGRMAHASLAVELLITQDRQQAVRLAEQLDALNRERQGAESEMVEAIIQEIEKNPQYRGQPAILMRSSNWHEGVIGIAAARLAQRFAKPVALLNQDGDQLRGSTRSIPGVDIFIALKACDDLLQAYGGHAMAAGLRLEVSNWEAFHRRLLEQIERGRPQAHPRPHLAIDMELALTDVTMDLVGLLDRLRPFGQAVPEPLFMARDIAIVNTQLLGGRHRRMALRPRGNAAGRPVGAIQFNLAPDGQSTPHQFDKVAFHVRRDYWNGGGIQLLVVATEP